MKKIFNILLGLLLVMALITCSSNTENKGEENTASAGAASPAAQGGQSNVKDDASQKNVVQVAIGSPDHTTLVAAVKQAELVDALSNAGPFTVFAPTNAAFDKLPKGTVEGLMKADKKADLQNILQYHVAVAVYKAENLQDGQIIGEVNGDNVTVKMKDGKPTINGANIIASIPASNGIVHVIDAVLLPPTK